MAAGFVFLEWLNHAVINPRRLLEHSEYGQVLVPGVRNPHLLYALASFAALALLWALPFPQDGAGVSGVARALHWSLRGIVFAATAAIIVFLTAEVMRVKGAPGLAGEQESFTHQRQN
jgi:hypothetical protein